MSSGFDPPNRILRRKWDEKNTLRHHLRILAAKPQLGLRNGKTASAFPHLVNNQKREQTKDERNNEIEKENMSLYMKMKAILVNSRESSRKSSNRKYELLITFLKLFMPILRRGQFVTA